MQIEEKVLAANKFPSLNEMQKKCVPFLGESLVVSAPTASGKTVVAELFALNEAYLKKKKTIYTCPLRALASEHYKDFKRKYPELKFALSTGDLDSNSSYLKKFDVIMTTYEKLASLLRHKAEWLNDVGCIIVDELHELDSSRGVVLEVALTQMRINNPSLVVLGLSATIPNATELSNWLSAKLVESDYRPTKLKEGILFEKEISYNDDSREEKNFDELIEKNLAESKQFLFFASSRKKAEALSKKISEKTRKFLDDKKKSALASASKKALGALETPTEQCTSLSETIIFGSAFHHAGLVNAQRELVEENFRAGNILALCSTTTLAAGVNTPADIVVIPSLYRFEKYGMELISVREYKQMVGRSGRPKFSTEGKGIVIANSENQKELFLEKFVNGKMEPVESKLSIIPVLRTHVLALIASGYIDGIKTIESFFEKTLYAHQYQNMSELLDNVLEIIEELEEFGFVQKKEKFEATKIGKRVSDLFLDPQSAFELIQALKTRKTFTSFSYLYAWTNCFEFLPLFQVPSGVKPILTEELSLRLEEIPFKEEKALFETESNQKFFSAIVIEQWINEKKEDDLFKNMGIAPGSIFGKTQIIEWLAYSTAELAKEINEERHIVKANKLALRVKHGVKEELLSLVELKGIGRARARKLFSAGIKSPSEVKSQIHKVEAILGKNIAAGINNQLFSGKKDSFSGQKTL